MRLINADALIPSFIKKAHTMKDRHGVKLGEDWLLNYNDIKDVIDNAPTECKAYRSFCMAKQRPQGKWINQFIGGNECVMCSECKLHFDIGTNYCPNCGAQMDEEKEGSS